jgi:chromosome segregation ATPase
MSEMIDAQPKILRALREDNNVLRARLAEAEAELQQEKREREWLLRRLGEAEGELKRFKASVKSKTALDVVAEKMTAEDACKKAEVRLAELQAAAGAVADAAYTSEMFATVLVPSERIRALERALGRGAGTG